MASDNGTAEGRMARVGHGRQPGDWNNPVLWFVELAEAVARDDADAILRCQGQLWRLGWDVKPPERGGGW